MSLPNLFELVPAILLGEAAVEHAKKMAEEAAAKEGQSALGVCVGDWLHFWSMFGFCVRAHVCVYCVCTCTCIVSLYAHAHVKISKLQ
jgi:hypothetical protein